MYIYVAIGNCLHHKMKMCPFFLLIVGNNLHVENSIVFKYIYIYIYIYIWERIWEKGPIGNFSCHEI